MTADDLKRMGLVPDGNGGYRKPPVGEIPPAPCRPDGSKNRLFALGRKEKGKMNKTESAYYDLIKSRKLVGEIVWCEFEAIKLKLADNTFLTVDFPMVTDSGDIEMHDVKGHKAVYQEDAKVKMKVAAKMFPFFRFFVVYPVRGGEWKIEEVRA